jgi:outer membrane protein OmpA-like peptidoglycan-associated protein
MKYLLICISLSTGFLYAQNKSLSVYFPFAGEELAPEERKKLIFFLADSLDKSRDYSVDIAGYCDFVDDDDVNNQLSLTRARHVENILLANGIQAADIASVKGLGESKATDQATTVAERQQQRRVDILFTCKCSDESVAQDTIVDKKGMRYKGRYLVTDDLVLRKFETGDSIVLVRLRFQPGRHKLLEESVPILVKLHEQLAMNPDMRIMIVGHVCCQDPSEPDGLDRDTNRFDLSHQRALEVYTYLVKKGISKDRLEYRGVGPSQKLYPEEKNAAEQSGNRRVEIVVLQH